MFQKISGNSMVARLRRKFVITAMTSLLIILALIIGGINIANYVQLDQNATEKVTILYDNNGIFPIPVDVKKIMDQDISSERENSAVQTNSTVNGADPSDTSTIPASDNAVSDNAAAQTDRRGTGPRFMDPSFDRNRRMEAPFETRYFTVLLDSEGNVMDIHLDNIAAVASDTASEYALTVQASGKITGYLGAYKYKIKNIGDGNSLCIFVDCSSTLGAAHRLLMMTLLIGLVALLGMFLLVLLFSGRAVAPVVESLEKQKRFISDAGHELKTPLSVISANVDVIEMTGQKSDWTISIRHQIRRMTDLVANMLTLSRMEEDSVAQIFEDIDLSQIVLENADTYLAVAKSQDKTLSSDIQEGIHMKGDLKSMGQLCTLLLDNAMKYSPDHGSIHLYLSAGKKITLEVSNNCDQIPEGNLDRLFDRFYRADTSRNRSTGGYGIGLSVARAICTSHGGDIHALRDGDNTIRFVAHLPLHHT